MNSTQHSLKLGLICVLSAASLSCAAFAAQSVPAPKKTVAPHLNDALSRLSGEVRVLAEIDEFGYVTSAQVETSTNRDLDRAALDAIYRWTFDPAEENGIAVPARVLQPFFFNSGTISMSPKQTPADTHPVAKMKVSPTLTRDLRSISGEVTLMATVSEQGEVQAVQVTRSTHPELEGPAVAALAKWRFKPAVESGIAVNSKVIVPFDFKGEGAAAAIAKANRNESVDRAPLALRRPTPSIPAELRQERAETRLKLVVDEHGYVADVSILEATNEALARAAQEAAFQWTFRPALKDGRAVATTVIQPFTFNGGIIMADAPVDSMPVLLRSKEPNLPKSLSGIQGYVKVRLNLDEQGRVISASSAQSSHEELVQPTLDAAKTWTFKPAIRGGQKIPSAVDVPVVFNERG